MDAKNNVNNKYLVTCLEVKYENFLHVFPSHEE